MGAMKRFFEETLPELTDNELMELGYSEEDIKELRGIDIPEEEYLT